MATRSRRSFLKDALKTVTAGAAGLTLGLSSATPAEACAVYCTYRYTGNELGSSCLYKRVYRCTSKCSPPFDYCTNKTNASGFCLSRNHC